jgi:hypothetical protein
MVLRFLVPFLLCGYVFAQTQTTESCSAELTRSEGDNHRIRVSTGVSEAFVEKQVLPATSDIDKKLKSVVIVRALIDKKGAVRCAEAVEGNPNLFERTTQVALLWRFKPYLLNGQPIIVETPIEFEFSRGKVKAR